MARLVGTIHRYIGTSTEEKPYVGQMDMATRAEITAADLPAGSTFEESDTGDEYRFDGRGWSLIGSATALSGRIVDRLDEILEELRTQTGHLAAGSELSRGDAEEIGR